MKGSTSVVKELVIFKVNGWESRNKNLMWCIFGIKRKWKLRKYIICKGLNFIIVLVILIKFFVYGSPVVNLLILDKVNPYDL